MIAALDGISDVAVQVRRAPRTVPLPTRLTESEREAHGAFVATLADGGLWSK